MPSSKRSVKSASKPSPNTAKRPAGTIRTRVPPPPKVVANTAPSESGEKLNTNTLVDIVTERTGQKRKDVKPIVEAMLAELKTSLLKGDQIVLQPMGKIMVKREKDTDAATILNCKIRLNK